MSPRLFATLRGFALVSYVMVGGCAVNSDHSMTFGMRGSQLWHRDAPVQDIWAYYDTMSLAELCEHWGLSHRSGSTPNQVADKALLESMACRGKRLSDCGPRYRFEDPRQVWYSYPPPRDLPRRCDYPQGNGTPTNN